MPWIKRNLYFVITMVVGLAVSGYCGFLLMGALSDNSKASEDYGSKQSSLKTLNESKPFPTEANIKAAQEDATRVRQFLDEFRKSFAPFPTPSKMDDAAFSHYVEQSIKEFRDEATNSGVSLFPDYAFGFAGETNKLNYPPECIDPWLDELEQIRMVLGIFCKAKVNFLEKIRRPAVSLNDIGGGDDYTQFGVATNQYGVVTPYKIEFRAFSKEIADVLGGIASSSNCFIVKAPYIQKSTVPLPELTVDQPTPAPTFVRPPPQRFQMDMGENERFGRGPGGRGGRGGPGQPGFSRPFPPRQPEPMVPAPVVPAGPTTILTEKPLFVTLYLEIIKPKQIEAPAPAPGAKQKMGR